MKPTRAAPDVDSKAKILLWDIECTHLKADFGTVLAIGFKWYGDKKVHCLKITDFPMKHIIDDRGLIQAFMEIIGQADLIVTYNGLNFDVKYLKSKLLKYRLPPFPPRSVLPHVDLYFTVKENMAITRKSLANVSNFLELKATKTPVTGNQWMLATAGDRKALKYVVDHCIADVELLEEAYDRLRALVATHPRVNGWGPCRTCGAEKMQSRGYSITGQKHRKRKLQCQSCGAWEARPLC